MYQCFCEGLFFALYCFQWSVHNNIFAEMHTWNRPVKKSPKKYCVSEKIKGQGANGNCQETSFFCMTKKSFYNNPLTLNTFLFAMNINNRNANNCYVIVSSIAIINSEVDITICQPHKHRMGSCNVLYGIYQIKPVYYGMGHCIHTLS